MRRNGMGKNTSAVRDAVVSAICAAIVATVIQVLIAYRVYWAIIPIAIGVCTFLVVLYHHPSRFYRRLVWACLGLLGSFIAVPSLRVAGVFGTNSAIAVMIDSIGTGGFLGLCGVCVVAMLISWKFDRSNGREPAKKSPVISHAGEDGIAQAAVGDGAVQEVMVDRSDRHSGGIKVEGVGKSATVNVTVNNYYYVDGLPQSPNLKMRRIFEEASALSANGEYIKAIEGFKKCLNLEDDHKKCGALNLQIGNCYYSLRKYLKAAEYYSDALKLARKAKDLEGEAPAQASIANTYLLRTAATGFARGANIRTAVDYYASALEIYKKDEYPVNYATTQNNLGTAYTYLPAATSQERAENVRAAIKCYEAALEIYKKDEYPVDYATTQNNLGNAYTYLPAATSQERAENVRAAIKCYEAALEIRKKDEYPQFYCQTAANMGLLLASVDGKEACYCLREAYSLREYLEDQGKRLEEVMERVCKD